MSIEEALKENATASLELAKAMRFYAETINKYGLKIEQANTGGASEEPGDDVKTDSAPAKKKPGRPPAKKPEPEQNEDDGFGALDDEPEDDEPELTAESVKTILLQVRDKYEDKAPALAIIAKFGYKAIPDIKAKDYAAIYAAAKKELSK